MFVKQGQYIFLTLLRSLLWLLNLGPFMILCTLEVPETFLARFPVSVKSL